jgi:hypothetical protein
MPFHGGTEAAVSLRASPSCRDTRAASGRPTHSPRKEHAMLDVIMLVLGFGFFALAMGYVHACDRL